jgi:hypothetical protein
VAGAFIANLLCANAEDSTGIAGDQSRAAAYPVIAGVPSDDAGLQYRRPRGCAVGAVFVPEGAGRDAIGDRPRWLTRNRARRDAAARRALDGVNPEALAGC